MVHFSWTSNNLNDWHKFTILGSFLNCQLHETNRHNFHAVFGNMLKTSVVVIFFQDKLLYKINFLLLSKTSSVYFHSSKVYRKGHFLKNEKWIYKARAFTFLQQLARRSEIHRFVGTLCFLLITIVKNCLLSCKTCIEFIINII